jgi:hypothetical protein
MADGVKGVPFDPEGPKG